MSPGSALAGLTARPSMLTAVAALLLASALADTAGFFGPGALALATAALGAAALAARRARAAPEANPSGGMRVLLAAGMAGFLVYDLIKAPSSARLPFFALLGVVVLTLAAEVPSLARRLPRGFPVERSRLVLWIACAAVMGVLTLRGGSAGWIDVWTFQQDAAAALMRGENPYSIPYRNVYDDLRYYSPAVADARFVYAFPYPPQTILADLPAYALLGDVRYTMLAALLVAGWSISRLAPPGIRDLAAGLLLFHPKTTSLLRGAWTEPTVLAAALLFLLALRRLALRPPRGWIAAGVAGALLAGSKQYTPLLVAPLLPALPLAGRIRTLALAAGLLAAVFLPFVLWDAGGLWEGVMAMQVKQRFRPDSLAWPAALAALGLGTPPAPVGFALSIAALILTWPRRGTLAQGVACGAVAFLTFILSAKQAFLNYHWLANAVLLTAALLQAGEERAPAVSEREKS